MCFSQVFQEFCLSVFCLPDSFNFIFSNPLVSSKSVTCDVNSESDSYLWFWWLGLLPVTFAVHFVLNIQHRPWHRLSNGLSVNEVLKSCAVVPGVAGNRRMHSPAPTPSHHLKSLQWFTGGAENSANRSEASLSLSLSPPFHTHARTHAHTCTRIHACARISTCWFVCFQMHLVITCYVSPLCFLTFNWPYSHS